MTDQMYTGKTMQASFRNVNLKARSAKEGMIYKFEAEITEEDWDQLRNADLTGSLFEANLECIEVGQRKEEKKEEKKEDRKVGGPLSKSAAQLCEVEKFQEFLRETYRDSWKWHRPNAPDDSGAAARIVREICDVQSRAEIDHDPEASKRFHQLVGEYRKWIVGG